MISLSFDDFTNNIIIKDEEDILVLFYFDSIKDNINEEFIRNWEKISSQIIYPKLKVCNLTKDIKINEILSTLKIDEILLRDLISAKKLFIFFYKNVHMTIFYNKNL